mmetsp:Transcript_29084/g.43854  ORF Transcript_29084/g.43854 Transcript_29084/m.43854 type:complete len:85 (+) Transcript_29084:389-643(+)
MSGEDLSAEREVIGLNDLRQIDFEKTLKAEKQIEIKNSIPLEYEFDLEELFESDINFTSRGLAQDSRLAQQGTNTNAPNKVNDK